MFWPALLFVGQLWLGEITRKRPKRVSWEEFLESNEPSEIRPIPYAGGTIEITPSRIWYGDFKQRAVERDSHWTDYLWAGAFAFLLDTITVAYRYYIGEAFAICYGPDRHAQRITIEDRPVYAAGLEFDNAGSGFLIDDPQAWGGDQPPGEGGQYSHCVLTRGNYTDAANVYLQQMLASGANKVPSLRGITSLISYGPSNTGVPESGYFAAGGVGYTPRLKEWKVVVRGQPDNLATGFNKIGRHMNPMEVIYEWSTSMEYGARVPDVELNLANWRVLAETLHDEGTGWSGKIEGQTSPGEVVRDVLAQIDAVPDFSPSLGMGFRLIRRDYSIGSLRVLDKSVITRVDEFTPGTYEDTVNKVQVEFPEDQDNNFKPRKALYIDPANQQVQNGRVVPQTVGYLGVADFEQANVISTRLGRAQSLPRAPLECSVFPSWGRLTYVGEVVLFEWASPSLSIVMRVLKITPNGPDEQDYRLVLMEDQFSTGLRTFGEPAGERHDDPAAGLATAPPSATWNEAEFPPDGLIFTLQTANTNEFLATITGGVIFGTYAPGGQYARIWVTEPGGVQTLSPLRLAPDTNNEATFTWPALAAGVYEFCVQTFSLRDATNGVKVCADIAIAEIGSPSPSPSASISPSPSVSSSPSPSASLSPSASVSPSASQSPSSSLSPSASTSASVSPSSSTSPSISPSPSTSPSSSASPSAPAVVVGEALIYTGNGTTQSITGANISPDLVAVRRRPGGVGNSLPWTDNVRGVTKEIYSNSDGAETTNTDGLTSFDANGFSVGNSNLYNASSNGYVALLFQEVSNAFDIVTYTGTGVAHAINHGLGVVPELIIVKMRSASGGSWLVYAGPLSSPETKFMRLETTAAPATSSAIWNNTAPSSTQFTVGTSGDANSNGQTYVAYLFATINPGVKVGSYTGDGNTNGPTVTTGFKPRFVIIKRTDNTGNWVVFDDQRDSSSPHNTYHHLNTGSTAESVTTNTAGGVDFLSTGFQSIDSAAADININAATYIYLAIA